MSTRVEKIVSIVMQTPHSVYNIELGVEIAKGQGLVDQVFETMFLEFQSLITRFYAFRSFRYDLIHKWSCVRRLTFLAVNDVEYKDLFKTQIEINKHMSFLKTSIGFWCLRSGRSDLRKRYELFYWEVKNSLEARNWIL